MFWTQFAPLKADDPGTACVPEFMKIECEPDDRSPTAPGSRISTQLRRRNRTARVVNCGCSGAGSAAESEAARFGANDDARRVRRLDGIPFSARTISSRPRRSAIRMVAELKLLVDSSSSLAQLRRDFFEGLEHTRLPALRDEDGRCLNGDAMVAHARPAFPLVFSPVRSAPAAFAGTRAGSEPA